MAKRRRTPLHKLDRNQIDAHRPLSNFRAPCGPAQQITRKAPKRTPLGDAGPDFGTPHRRCRSLDLDKHQDAPRAPAEKIRLTPSGAPVPRKNPVSGIGEKPRGKPLPLHADRMAATATSCDCRPEDPIAACAP